MLIVLSPAKTLDLSPQTQTSKCTTPEFLDEAEILVKKLRGMSRRALGELMGISPELAELNQRRYQSWARPFTPENAKQAVLAFDGEVYWGLKAKTFRSKDLDFAQSHLRILSGLYGMLRPLDLMQPYRLEMGTKLAVRRCKSLYDFWTEKVTQAANDVLSAQRNGVLLNLASNEYVKALNRKQLDGRVVTAVFREIKNGKSRTIATFAKQARGMMAAWAIRNRTTDPAELVDFSDAEYEYVPGESTEHELVFARLQPPPVSG